MGVGAARMTGRGMEGSSSWGPRNSVLQGYGEWHGGVLGRNQTSVGAGGPLAIMKGDSLPGEGTGRGSQTVGAQDGGDWPGRPGMVTAGQTVAGFGSPGSGGNAGGGAGAPRRGRGGRRRCAPLPPLPPLLNKLFFLFKLRPALRAAAAAAARRARRPVRRSAGPGPPTRRPADPQARRPGATPASAPRIWRGAVGAGGAKPSAGHGLGRRGAGPRRQRAGGRAGQPGPCLVPPRPEPRRRRGTAGPGRPRWQLPGPRQRECGGRLRALRPVSGAGLLAGGGLGLGFLERGEGSGQWTPAPPRVGPWLYAEAEEGCRAHFLPAVSGAMKQSQCRPAARVAVRGGDAGESLSDPLRQPPGRRGWRSEGVHCMVVCSAAYRDWVSER